MKTTIPILVLALIILGNSMALAQQTISQNRALAAKMYTALTGVELPSDSLILINMEGLISSGQRFKAAQEATKADEFINVTVRNLAAPMSSRNHVINSGLNDFVATFMGVVRDDINAKKLLTGDFFYMGDATKIPASSAVPFDFRDSIVASNTHYDTMDNTTNRGLINLNKVLVQNHQKIMNYTNNAVDFPQNDVAGLLTTRQWSQEHLIAGTNRRAVQFAFSEFLCLSIDEIRDENAANDPALDGTISIVPTAPVTTMKTMIARDVTREPQNDATTFLNKCRACHNMLDYMRPAFGHFDFVNGFTRNTLMMNFKTTANPGPTEISVDAVTKLPLKYYSNETVFPTGHRLQNTYWYNNTINGSLAADLGWKGPTKGDGIQAFGQMLSESKAFSRCMVKRVFESVCHRPLQALTSEKGLADSLINAFETNNYRIKGIFEQVATRTECLGD